MTPRQANREEAIWIGVVAALALIAVGVFVAVALAEVL